ncbi:DUF4111 domain-containing protein [Salininema proteolyticum]|uniref:Uncharacterized protein n=1 Tax=Salininema proteolyticum TaxID=1607685 RepID=A0ABV8U0J2_9ACTN
MIPDRVRQIVDEYESLVDEHAPDLVESLYMTGSVALAGWREGHSDIDFVAVAAREPDAEDLSALGEIHSQIPEDVRFEGFYLSPAQLVRPRSGTAVAVSGNEVETVDGEDVPLALWAELAAKAVVVSGRAPGEYGLTEFPEGWDRWLRENLDGYWKRLAVEGLAKLEGRADSDPLPAVTAYHYASGSQRLYYTLRHRDFLSKQQALRYALQKFPQHEAVLEKAWRHGEDEPQSFTVADGKAACRLILDVVRDAERL